MIWRLAADISRITLLYLLLTSFLAASAQNLTRQEYQHELSVTGQAAQYFRQGMMAEQAGDKMHAIEFYRRAVGYNPRIKEVHYALGRVLGVMGDNEPALAEFQQALAIDNNYVQCRNDYGIYLKNRGQVDNAVREFKKCIDTSPKYPFAYYNLAVVLKEKGDLEGAIENFQSAVRLKPDFAEAQRDLGLAIFERASAGDLTTAVETLEKSARLAPRNSKVHYYLGFIYATKGNLDAAEAEYRKALICDSRMACAHWELARVRYLRGDLDRCMSEISYAEKVNPTYTSEKEYPAVSVLPMKTLYAQCLEFKGKFPQAIDTYKELVRLRGSDALYAKHIAELIKKIKTQERERKRKPLEYDPEEVDAIVAKGIDQYEDGALDAARSSFERVLDLNPISFEGLMNLSAVQEAQGDLNSALASNQKAIDVNPQFDGSYYNLAYLLEKMNLPSDAGAMYLKFHNIAGKYPYDPQHIIDLQQDIIRQQKIEENRKLRGY